MITKKGRIESFAADIRKINEMLLVITKELAIGGGRVTLYSIDRGKTWISRPRDLRLFKLRRRLDEKKLKEFLAAHVPNDL